MYRIPQVFVDKYQETWSGKRYGFGTVVSPSSAVGLVAWGSRRFSLAAFKILAIRSVLDSPLHGSFWWWSPGFTSDPPVETTWVVLLALPALDLVSGHGSAWAILNFLSCSMTRPSLSLAALDTPEDTQLLESGEHVLTPLNSSMSVGTPLDLGVNFGSWACQD